MVSLMQRVRGAFGIQGVLAPTADVQMVGIMPASSSEEYKGAEPLYDGAGNRFTCVSVFQKANNNTTWLLVTRTTLAGLVQRWVLGIPANTKTVGNPGLDHRGTALVITTGVYGMDSARISDVAYAEIPGVFVENSAPPPPPPPPTATDIVITAGPAGTVGTWTRRLSAQALQPVEQIGFKAKVAEMNEG